MTKIENQAQYEWAVKRVEELLPLVKDDTPLNDPNSIELELLSNLVADYSEEHFALGEPTLVDVLKLRMYEMGLNQKSLAKLVGVSPSRLSDYISGKCEPTLKVAREISRKLNIDGFACTTKIHRQFATNQTTANNQHASGIPQLRFTGAILLLTI